MIGLCPLASGSKGNCTYVGSRKTKILIDAGLGIRTLEQRLSILNLSFDEIDAIMITHEHGDHIRGLASLMRRKRIPIFVNADTARGMDLVTHQDWGLPLQIFSTGETFAFGDFQIHPFSIQHDTLDPVAFTVHVTNEPWKFGICTDLGYATSLVRRHLEGCTHLVLEANHQPSMVHACNRPTFYKQRVLSRQGHLSNQECAELLGEIAHPQLQHVYLAHLSSECNHPELALQIVADKMREVGLVPSLSIAWQDRPSFPPSLI
jgi:phosphoribosyl 1,2-cyclic phosphodiesterase